MNEQLCDELHKQPPHKRGMLNGCEVWSKTCPSCHAKVLVLIHEFKGGKVVRTFCQFCADPNSTAATMARKLQEHAMAGTLDKYPLAERIVDLEGKPYIKPNWPEDGIGRGQARVRRGSQAGLGGVRTAVQREKVESSCRHRTSRTPNNAIG